MLALTIPAQLAPLGAGLWLALCCGWMIRWLAKNTDTDVAGAGLKTAHSASDISGERRVN